MSDLAERVRSRAVRMLSDRPATQDRLNDALRLLAKYRALLLQNTVVRTHGVRVRAGPFAGLEFVGASAEGCHVPKLLGTYEGEPHRYVEAAAATGYEDVVNVGCAEGYYAVGLARRCPAARVHAFDTNAAARRACRELAGRNGVADRVAVGGLFAPEAFRGFRGRRALFVIDIEGHEDGLLGAVDPGDLAGFDLIVECHDGLRPGAGGR
ncbi:MAG: class I SAM-dependent methyltransferase, partial [Gemmataceae bacterium]|nr:class I SAM-dependent methyltransferase [Gemmataceae bacterium]